MDNGIFSLLVKPWFGDERYRSNVSAPSLIALMLFLAAAFLEISPVRQHVLCDASYVCVQVQLHAAKFPFNFKFKRKKVPCLLLL